MSELISNQRTLTSNNAFAFFFTFITHSQNTKISRVRYLKPPHSVPSLQIEVRFNFDRYRYRCDGKFWYPRISEIESRNRMKNGRRERGSTAVWSRIEYSLTCSTYETEDTENGGTVAHRTKNEKPKQNQTVTVTRNTLEVRASLYILSGAPGKFGARRAILDTDIGRVNLAEVRPADGCNLRLRIPLSSPLSVPRLGGGFPPTDSRNESDPGAIELRTHHLAISCNWDFAARRKDARFTASRTHWNWSRDSARGASPCRTKVASLHSELLRR